MLDTILDAEGRAEQQAADHLRRAQPGWHYCETPASCDSTVKIWDAHSGVCLQMLKDHSCSNLPAILTLQSLLKVKVKTKSFYNKS
jgi:hypothetical protein